MKASAPINTLFIDIGGVLLSNGWDHLSRRAAATQFNLDWDVMEARHQLFVADYEAGNISLQDYLNSTVFYQHRSFTLEQFKDFMLAQSYAYPEMISLVQQLKRKYGLKIVVVSNEAREVNAYRIQHYQLNRFVDFFISSCFVHIRKPDLAIFRLALDVSQTPTEQIIYIDNTLSFVRLADGLGIRGIVHTDYHDSQTQLATFGLSRDREFAYESA
jgi:putative hydrolase of the HAD superfamily